MPNTPPCSLFCSMPYEILPVWCRPCLVQRCCCASSRLTCRYLSYVHRCPDRSASWDNRWPLVRGAPELAPSARVLIRPLHCVLPLPCLPGEGSPPDVRCGSTARRWLPDWLPKIEKGPGSKPVPLLTWTFWSGRPDLNRRPLDPQSSALPNCATSRPPVRTL